MEQRSGGQGVSHSVDLEVVGMAVGAVGVIADDGQKVVVGNQVGNLVGH